MSIMNPKQARNQILRKVEARGPIGSVEFSFLNDFFMGTTATPNERNLVCDAVSSLARSKQVYVTYTDDGTIATVEAFDCAKAEMAAMSEPIVDLDSQEEDTTVYFEDEMELDPSPGLVKLTSLVHQELLKRSDKDGKVHAETYNSLVCEITASLKVRTSSREVATALLYLYKLGLRESLKGRRQSARVRPFILTQQMIDCADSMGKTQPFEISMEDARFEVDSLGESAVRENILKTHVLEQQDAELAAERRIVADLRAELEAERQKTTDFARMEQENADLLVQNQELTDECQRLEVESQHMTATLVTFREAVDIALER